MKQKWIAFALTAMTLLTLMGCGEKDKVNNADDAKPNTNYTTPTDSENEKQNDTLTDKDDNKDSEKFDSTEDMGKTSEKTKIDNTVSGTQTSAINARGYVESNHNVRSWSQMVDNGRVHDRDGYLLDGENSHW